MPVPGSESRGLSVFSKPELEPSLEDELRMVDTPGFAASGGGGSGIVNRLSTSSSSSLSSASLYSLMRAS